MERNLLEIITETKESVLGRFEEYDNLFRNMNKYDSDSIHFVGVGSVALIQRLYVIWFGVELSEREVYHVKTLRGCFTIQREREKVNSAWTIRRAPHLIGQPILDLNVVNNVLDIPLKMWSLADQMWAEVDEIGLMSVSVSNMILRMLNVSYIRVIVNHRDVICRHSAYEATRASDDNYYISLGKPTC